MIISFVWITGLSSLKKENASEFLGGGEGVKNPVTKEGNIFRCFWCEQEKFPNLPLSRAVLLKGSLWPHSGSTKPCEYLTRMRNELCKACTLQKAADKSVGKWEGKMRVGRGQNWLGRVEKWVKNPERGLVWWQPSNPNPLPRLSSWVCTIWLGPTPPPCAVEAFTWVRE